MPLNTSIVFMNVRIATTSTMISENLESHRLTHTDIEKYMCEKCGQKFKFNTQLRRHLKTPTNCIKRKRSDSPEY